MYPIEALGLIADDVTRLASCFAVVDGKRVRGVEVSGRHGQADHHVGFGVVDLG